MKVSNCCGASPRNDIEEEMGLCSACGEYCDYEDDNEIKIPLEMIESHAGIACGKCKGSLDITTCPEHHWILKTVCKECGFVCVSYERCQECEGIINSKGEKI